MRPIFERVYRASAVGMALSAVLVTGACGKSEEAPAERAGKAATNPVDPATAGAVTGVVKLEGTPPAAEPITMDSDPYCQRQGRNTTETLVVGEGSGLQNVFVYVKDGLGERAFPVPSAAVLLDQKGCRYAPHVLGIQVG